VMRNSFSQVFNLFFGMVHVPGAPMSGDSQIRALLVAATGVFRA